MSISHCRSISLSGGVRPLIELGCARFSQSLLVPKRLWGSGCHCSFSGTYVCADREDALPARHRVRADDWVDGVQGGAHVVRVAARLLVELQFGVLGNLAEDWCERVRSPVNPFLFVLFLGSEILQGAE